MYSQSQSADLCVATLDLLRSKHPSLSYRVINYDSSIQIGVIFNNISILIMWWNPAHPIASERMSWMRYIGKQFSTKKWKQSKRWTSIHPDIFVSKSYSDSPVIPYAFSHSKIPNLFYKLNSEGSDNKLSELIEDVAAFDSHLRVTTGNYFDIFQIANKTRTTTTPGGRLLRIQTDVRHSNLAGNKFVATASTLAWIDDSVFWQNDKTFFVYPYKIRLNRYEKLGALKIHDLRSVYQMMQTVSTDTDWNIHAETDIHDEQAQLFISAPDEEAIIMLKMML